MAAVPSIGGPALLAVGAVEFHPSLAAVLLLLAVVGALIYAFQPPLPQSAVFAFLPWIVAGALLDVLATGAAYPTYLRPVVTAPGVYLTAACVPGLAWVAMLNFAVTRRGVPAYHTYLGAMGLGVVLVLLPTLVVARTGMDLERMLMLGVVPLLAVLAAGLVSLSVGLWSPDFVQYTPIIGGSAVFGALVNGIATIAAVSVGGIGAHTLLSASVAYVVVNNVPQGIAGVDAVHLWASLLIALYAFLGVVVATQPARFAAARPRAVYAVQGLLGVLWFGVGFDRLLQVVA